MNVWMSPHAPTNMEQGLESALAMARAASPREVRSVLGADMSTLFGLYRVDCWVMTADQRALVLDGENELFLCDDFRHPYAHALRQRRGMRLNDVARQPRLDHPGFQRQVRAVPHNTDLYLWTLAPDAAQAPLGVLACWGSSESIDVLIESDAARVLVDLGAFHWQQQKRSEDARRREHTLRSSLVTLREDERRRTAAHGLGEQVIGQSEAMVALRQQIVRAAETSMSVLLEGETGTGKDVIARALHSCSPRADKPFVAINCAAIPESLLESELFGHVKGAFSGASENRQGLIKQADGGSLFLDEIGDMPLDLQAKLLRVLESGHFRPLGATEEQQSSFRVIAATHQPLREKINDGLFRADLFYRLGQFPLRVPALAARKGDIELLARTFVRRFCEQERRPVVGLSSAALSALDGRAFPGNVRELKNVIEYALAMTPIGQDIDVTALEAREDAQGVEDNQDAETALALEAVTDLRQAARQFEASVIRARLARFEGNRAMTAESLNLPKRTLAHKCQQFRIGEE